LLINKTILDHMPEFGFGLIVGNIRSGKSALGYGLLEDLGLRYGREMLVYGLPYEKSGLLPEHIRPVYDVSQITEKSVILFDEAYKEFYSREWQTDSNKLIDTMSGLAGQKEILGVFITHQTRKLEVGVVAPLQFILYKRPSMLQSRFERPGVRSLTSEAYEAFKKYSKEEARKHTYVFFPDYVGMVEDSNVLPSWWSEDLSRAYKGVALTGKEPLIQNRILCLHCDNSAVGVCSFCKCSFCQEHRQLHSHGRVEGLEAFRVRA